MPTARTRRCLLCLLFFWGCSQRLGDADGSHGGDAHHQHIEVQGVGQASASPDTARVTLGVDVRGPEVSRVLAEMSARMRSVLEALKAAGIEAKDLQTRDLSLQLERPYPPPEANAGKPLADAFLAQSLVEVTVRKLDRLGELLAVGLGAGANHLSSLQFLLDDGQTLEALARSRAVANARQKAEQLAKNADVRLGRVLWVQEQSGGMPWQGPQGLRAHAAVAADAVPVERGSQSVSVQVQMAFQLR